MSITEITEKMPPMTTREERGQRLRAWAKSEKGRIEQLREESGVSRSQIANAFKGEASESTYGRLERAVTYLIEHEEDATTTPHFVSVPADRAAGGIIEFEVSADAVGLKVFVRGPIENGDELSEQAAKVFREIQKQMPESGDLGNQD